MRSSLDYTGFAQLCGRSPIMRKIMRAHNSIIPRSLVATAQNGTSFCRYHDSHQQTATHTDARTQTDHATFATMGRILCCV